MKINIKLIFFGIIFLIVYMGLSSIYLSNNVDALYKTKYQEVADRMKRELAVHIKEKSEAILILGISLSQIERVKEAFETKNVEKVNLKEYSHVLRDNTSLKNVWFQLVNKEGVSLYRSWTEKRGDSIVGIRVDIVDVLKNPKMSSSISTGRFDMTFKSTVPVYKNEEFLGFVETIARFNSIVLKIKEYNFDALLMVDKSYKNQLSDTITNRFIGDYYLAASSGSKILEEFVQKKGVEHFLNVSTYMIDAKNNQLICLYKVPDVHGEDMGYFILATPLSEINTLSIQNSKKKMIVGLMLGFLVIAGFLVYIYTVNYKNYIQRQREELERSVINKTRELKNISEEMEHLAHHDSLTGLPNRLLFHQKLNAALVSAKENSYEVGVLFLDLDNFKDINDTYGHDVGDMLLQKITYRLQEAVRETDTIARLGGDEFTIVVEHAKRESVEKVALKIADAMRAAVHIDKLELFVSFSIGISLYPDDGESADLLIKYADTAMYKAKEDGKSRHQFYNCNMTEITMSKLELKNSLKVAILEQQFEPYYQPKIDARTLKVVGLEALVRWVHPEKGIISPLEFIAYAEETGLIAEIDHAMLNATLKQMKEWHSEGISTGRVSLNISSKQLEDMQCVEGFAAAIEKFNFNTDFLELEVTEGQVMKNQVKSVQILQAMKDLGISIALDDFGTGYSSLSYLKNLPVDRLKIDRSFIVDISDDDDDIAIIKTIIALGKNLKLDLIAEGVETQEQVDFLLEEGCYKIQGYFYSKPLPAKECKIFLQENA